MNESAASQGRQGQGKIALKSAEDGALLLPSVFTDARGAPRFELPIPRAMLRDVAIKYLVEHEAGYGGYEYPTRAFFEAHLEPDDLFIDVGAHWGVMALSAATRHRGEVRVLAIEAHPLNVVQLIRAVAHNRLQDAIEIVAAGAGDAPGTAPLVANSTMGHSINAVGLKGAAQGDRISVPLVTLDGLLDERPELAERRTFVKIDVEGFEPQAIAGARRLLDSGRVAALVWEKGRAFDEEPGSSAMSAMIAGLRARGFTLWRLPSHDLGGPLLPFVPGKGTCNVFCLAPGFAPRPAYVRPPGPVPPVGRSNRTDDDPAARAALTEALIAAGGSDGTRWADPQQLAEGAQARAKLAAAHVKPGERVLDLGAGLMRLRTLLPEGATYRPLDLVPFAANSIVADLNRGDFPEERFDAVTALEVFEYVHDLPALLARCAKAAARLVCTYHTRSGETAEARRQKGWVNDYDAAAFKTLLQNSGWTVETCEEGAGTRLFVCGRV